MTVTSVNGADCFHLAGYCDSSDCAVDAGSSTSEALFGVALI